MKKILLSIGLIGLFTFYAIEQRHQVATTQVSVAGSSQNAPAPTAASSGNNPESDDVGKLININGTIYLIKQDGLYGFPSMAVFNSWGYDLSQVELPNSADSQLAVVGVMQEQNTVASSPTPTAAPTQSGQYKDGTYTGTVANAVYGNIQVSATISGGKLTDVEFLQYPHDRGESIQVNSQAMPLLKSEAIAAQSAQVDTVSGATQSSGAFRESLGAALQQAM